MMRTLLAVLVACLAAAVPPAAAQAPTGDDALVGLWAYEVDYGPVLRGPLALRRSGVGWTGEIGGTTASAPAAPGEIRLRFGTSSFRGRLSADGRTIAGFWLQPSGETEDRHDPGGSGQPFATPLVLHRAGAGLWRGTVTPLDDRFTLYLNLFRNESGELLAAFRNPETNSNGGASQFRVSRDGDRLSFDFRYDGGAVHQEATLVRGPDRIRMRWDDLGRTIELSRRDPAAAHFLPRPAGAPPYAYRTPPATGDGWRTDRAANVGIDEEALSAIVRDIAGSDPSARRPRLIHSLLVAHRGRLVLDEYFFGYDRETPHDTRSAGKTFSSVMLGAAMMQRRAISPDTRIYALLQSLGPFANPDPRKAEITLAHLMTHSAGLACNDNDDASPGNEGIMTSQDLQPDWWKYTLDLPMAHDPGRRYAYCSANINLVGGALTRATNTWLPELFDRTVARPLQFGRYHWNLTANGAGYLGGGAFLRPRDLLKVGQAYLDGGVWNGRRIVTPQWVRSSTERRIAIDEATTGYSAEEFGNYYGRGADALAWHLGAVTAAGRSYATYAATGNGGQILLVVPEAELVVAFTGGNYRQGGIWGRWAQEIVGDRIIPAIRAEQGH